MSRFNTYFNNDFRACKLLAYKWDSSRKRDVRIYLMPGELECVGMSDGVDKWICPVIYSHPYSDVLQKLVSNHIHGIPNPKPVPHHEIVRRRIVAPAIRRKIVIAQPPRRRYVILP